MANIALEDLIEALAGAVIEAQDAIEKHQISNLASYFSPVNSADNPADPSGPFRPKRIVLRVPSLRPDAGENEEDEYQAPLLSLVSTNQLKIKDVEISFDVDMGILTEGDAGAKPPEGGSAGNPAARKSVSVDMGGGLLKRKGGNIHVVLRVEGGEPTEGAARLINHLNQTQGVFRKVDVD